MTKIVEKHIEHIAMKEAKTKALFMLGRYSAEDKLLCLAPKNVFPILKLKKIDNKYARSIFLT